MTDEELAKQKQLIEQAEQLKLEIKHLVNLKEAIGGGEVAAVRLAFTGQFAPLAVLPNIDGQYRAVGHDLRDLHHEILQAVIGVLQNRINQAEDQYRRL